MAEKDDKKSFVVGNRPVEELLVNKPKTVDFVWFRKGRHDKALDNIVKLCKQFDIPFKSVDKQDLDRVYRGNHQGVAARTASLEYTPLDDILDIVQESPLPLIVALDQVQDPGNVGTLSRTLYALGATGMIVCRHHGAYLGTGAVRSSAGALNLLPIARADNLARSLAHCRDRGFNIYCAKYGEEAENAFTFKPKFPAILVLGNEEKGVRPGVAKHATADIEIPMARQFDSLNVSQAGAIISSMFARFWSGY